MADADPAGEDVGLLPLEHRRGRRTPREAACETDRTARAPRRGRRREPVPGSCCLNIQSVSRRGRSGLPIRAQSPRSRRTDPCVELAATTVRSRASVGVGYSSPAKAPIPRSAVVSSLRVIRRKIRKPMTTAASDGHQQQRRKGVERGRRRRAGGVVDLHRHRFGRRADGQVAHQHEVVDDVGEHQHRAGEDRGHQHRQRDPAQRPEGATRRDPLRLLRIACRWWPAWRAPTPPDRPPDTSPGRPPVRRCPARSGSARFVTTNSSATASSTSGMTNEISISTFAPEGSRPRHRSMPIANSTPSGTRDQGGDDAEFQRLQQRGVQRGVVPDRPGLVTPVPPKREALPVGSGPAVVEREHHGDEHRQQRPHQIRRW